MTLDEQRQQILAQVLRYAEQKEHRKTGSLANANIITERSFWLGIYPGLIAPMLDHIADSIAEFLGVAG